MLLKRLIPIVLIVSLLAGCGKFPFSNRYGSLSPSDEVISETQESTLGEEAFQEILKKEASSLDGQLITLVERVGRQLAAVSPLPHLNWEFKLVESSQKNLIALPGGKVIVYSGILPVCANEAGLAALMSHQMAHDIARHRAQRLAVILDTGAYPAATPVGLSNARNKDDLLSALGIGRAGEWMGPFNPDQEYEADETGLMLMVKAGYDPVEAERFWSRVATMQRGSRSPELLSFHPIEASRLTALRGKLAQANRAYRANPLKHGLGQSFLYILSRRKMQEMQNKSSPSTHPSGNPVPGPH